MVVIGGLVATTLSILPVIFTVLFAISVIVVLPSDEIEDGEANRVIPTPHATSAIKTTNIIIVFFSIVLPKINKLYIT